MASLREQIVAYRRALDRCASAADTSANAVLSLLLAREQIARAMRSADLAAEDLKLLQQLDVRLRAMAPVLVKRAGGSLAELRDAMSGEELSWWWQLDDHVAAEEGRKGALWSLLAAILFPLSLSLAVDTSTRFLSGTPDALGVLGFLGQGFLALLGGAALSEAWRAWIGRWLKVCSLGSGPRRRASLAAMVFLLVLAIWLALPLVAVLYNNRGQELHAEGRMALARQCYERALKLDPGYAVAHYNLAALYQDLGLSEQAITEYQTALLGDPELVGAANNLAWIYLQSEEYATALDILTRALEIAEQPGRDPGRLKIEVVQLPDWSTLRKPVAAQKLPVQYFLRRNRGWAYLGLDQPELALYDLDQALALNPAGATAYCLRAGLHEKQGRSDAAFADWTKCLRKSQDGADLVDSGLLSRARQAVLQRIHGG